MEARVKWSLITLAMAVLVLGIGGAAYAFHSGGVAECSGCHSMHSAAAGGSFLLVGNDQSSTCLTCHEKAADTGPSSYHVSTAPGSLGVGQSPLHRSPGGDFGWLKKTYTWTLRGTANTEEGRSHGHNIVAVDKGYAADLVNTTAPGGTFPAAQLACNSCHDPHGKYRRLADGTVARTGAPIIGSGSYGSSTEPSAGYAVGVYRLLAGAGYTKGTVTFNGVPAAKAPSTYNRTEASTQTRVAYGKATSGGHVSWGDWCGTCHAGMLTGKKHPVDQNLGSTTATQYNQYKKTGDMTGTATTSFTSLAPFISNTSDYTALALLAVNNDSKLDGPASNDQVSCMTCHRAHASGWMNALRFNMESDFMVYQGAYPGTDNAGSNYARGRTAAETQTAYYDRPATVFGTYQRAFCNKCHAND